METTQAVASQKKKSKLVWFGLGTLALGTLTFLGIKHFKTKNTNQNDNSSIENETNPEMDHENSPKNYTKPTDHSIVSADSHHPSFPLKIGDKGDTVLKLQRALVKSYGTAIFKKFGADGKFGNEIASFLKNKGYKIPLSETDYRSLTKEKKEEVDTPHSVLTSFNPTVIAYALFTAITGKDFLSAMTLLKGITTTNQYALVSEEFKKYRINGVRQTIVNALFSNFKSINQKIVIQSTLQKIGLTYDGEKWRA